MIKVILFILSTLTTTTSSNRCVLNRNGPECVSDVCFSHYYQQDSVYNCDAENTKLNKTSCRQMLNVTGETSICFKNGKETHCCCLASSSPAICAPEHRKSYKIALWSSDHTENLIFGHISFLILSAVFFSFYIISTRKWPTENLRRHRFVLELVSTISILFLCFLLHIIWEPINKGCSNHGSRIDSTIYLYEIIPASLRVSIFFSFPTIFLVTDIAFLILMITFGYVNKAGYIAVVLFKMLTVVLLIVTISSVFLETMENRVNLFCNISSAFSICTDIFILLVMYVVSNGVSFSVLCLAHPIVDERPMTEKELSNHMTSMESSRTAEAQIESDKIEMITVSPRPFHVPRFGMSLLSIRNNFKKEWVALRILLSTTGFYRVYPPRLLIPPEKEISVEVEQTIGVDFSQYPQHNLLIEWYCLGDAASSIDNHRLWSKPYLVPQSRWHFFVLPIYVDESTDSRSIAELL